MNLNELQARDKNNSILLDFLNIIIRAGLKAKSFSQIGRFPKFFLVTEKKAVEGEALDMWPGYETTTKWLNDGIFLNVDTATKFINQKTILDNIRNFE